MTQGSAGFECPVCGAVSHNPNDAREEYCGACHRFAVDVRQVQFLEARRYTLEEIAQLCQVPPEMVRVLKAKALKIGRRKSAKKSKTKVEEFPKIT
jgi:hypothetical protein